jgi:hypothetical protein
VPRGRLRAVECGAARGPQSRSARWWGDESRPPTLHRDDITGPQLRASTRRYPAVDLHLTRLQQLLRVHAMLGEAREFEELADPNRVPGDRDVEYRGAGHLAILPEPNAPDVRVPVPYSQPLTCCFAVGTSSA